ncbi:MAG: type II toxin-antitoxin system RelE/ParE family toxin [Betaproteobacteria bacterium]|nr:type II toxin-antitoxin system RelE/ParE family toxin [Betaproteobacteria bacterium]
MASVQLSARAAADLERIFDYVARSDPKAGTGAVSEIRRAIEMLGTHPLIGRKVAQGRRELVISRGRFGYVALYQWYEHYDSVLVLAIKHQSEAGYVDE